MALVRPDLMEKSLKTLEPSTTDTKTHLLPATSSVNESLSDPQTLFYEKQLVKERLSPRGSLIEILAHLLKEQNRVLHDTNLKSSEKLRKYNQLMVKSDIMVKKAKTVGRAASTFNPTTLKADESEEEEDTDIESDASSNASSILQHSDIETESDVETWADTYSRAPSPTPHYSAAAASTSRDTEISDDIIRRIPLSYQKTATQLYKLLNKKARGKNINWTNTGELVVDGQPIPDSNIADLLTDAARQKSTVRPLAGRNDFVKVVKRLNPSLKHVRNKSLFSATTSSSKKKKTSPLKRKSQQTGSGNLSKIVWHTTL